MMITFFSKYMYACVTNEKYTILTYCVSFNSDMLKILKHIVHFFLRIYKDKKERNGNLPWHIHEWLFIHCFQFELEFRIVGFCGGGKIGESGQKPPEQG